MNRVAESLDKEAGLLATRYGLMVRLSSHPPFTPFTGWQHTKQNESAWVEWAVGAAGGGVHLRLGHVRPILGLRHPEKHPATCYESA